MIAQFSNYDVGFGLIILASAIFAIVRGGVAEILSLSSWFIAVFVAYHYGKFLDASLKLVIDHELLRGLITYLIAFIIIFIIISIIRKICEKFIKSAGLSELNYLIGLTFGVLRGIIICGLGVMAIEGFNLDNKHAWRSSLFAPVIIPTIGLIVEIVPDQFKTNKPKIIGDQS